MIDDVLEGLFDYAGMYPPASLGFEDALREAATFPTALQRPALVQNDMVLAPDAWRRLDDAAFASAGYDRACSVCIVGVPAADAGDLAKEILAWNRAGATARPPRRVTSLEVHMDEGLGLGTIDRHIASLRHILVEGDVRIYLEPRWPEASWLDRLDELMGLFDALQGDTELPPVGLKFRCAGPTALSPDAVSAVLDAAVGRHLPLKATQGLHHPIVEARYDNGIGFLGLVAALRLRAAVDLSIDEMTACLVESDPGAFRFEDGLTWRDRSCSRGELGRAMALPFSIGSCSLSEPDADLARLFPAT